MAAWQVHAPAPDSSPSPRGRLVMAVPGPTACSDGCSAWGGVLGPDPAGASLQLTGPPATTRGRLGLGASRSGPARWRSAATTPSRYSSTATRSIRPTGSTSRSTPPPAPWPSPNTKRTRPPSPDGLRLSIGTAVPWVEGDQTLARCARAVRATLSWRLPRSNVLLCIVQNLATRRWSSLPECSG
jgi:hypothetical protein